MAEETDTGSIDCGGYVLEFVGEIRFGSLGRFAGRTWRHVSPAGWSFEYATLEGPLDEPALNRTSCSARVIRSVPKDGRPRPRNVSGPAEAGRFFAGFSERW